MPTVYRHAAWDTPWRVNPSRSTGRYNAAGELVQYWCTHPLGPAAEMARAHGISSTDELADLRLRMWAATLDLGGLTRITFANATEHGITAEKLVSEDYAATQALARRLRDTGSPGLVVPSAALPGTDNVVLFGPRVLSPYLYDPIDPEQVATAHIADTPPAPEVAGVVRRRGTEHEGLVTWQRRGTTTAFIDPPVTRPHPVGPDRL